MLYPNGEYYDGGLNGEGMREGRGVCYYVNGDVYEGDWVKDKRHGRGKLSQADGGEYVGEFRKD